MQKKAEQVKIQQPLPEVHEDLASGNSVEQAKKALETLNDLVIRDYKLLDKLSKGEQLTEEEKQSIIVNTDGIDFEDLTKQVNNLTKNLNNVFIK